MPAREGFETPNRTLLRCWIALWVHGREFSERSARRPGYFVDPAFGRTL